MQNQRFNRNIFGDLPTQKMAQKALPILVAYAQKCKTITLAELAAEIAPHLVQFNRTMAWVFVGFTQRFTNWSGRIIGNTEKYHILQPLP